MMKEQVPGISEHAGEIVLARFDLFPAQWLDPTPRDFYGVPVYISGVQFEYAIKTNVQLLNPEWQLCDKDRAAVRILRAEMARCGLNERDVLAQIWSHTPYWVKRGYPEYADAIRVDLGGDVSPDKVKEGTDDRFVDV